jgi:hypothetical protein
MPPQAYFLVSAVFPAQLPTLAEAAGVALVVTGVALHRGPP